MMKRCFTCLLFGAVLTFSGTAGVDLESQVEELKLGNGMVFLLLRRPKAEVVSTVISFRVGGADEKVGYTGLAHMFEHMAFKGTEHIGTRNYEAERKILEEIESVGEELAQEEAKGPDADSEKVKELREKIAALQAQEAEYIVKDELWDTYLQNGAKDLNAGTSKDLTSYYVSLPANRLELWALMESQRMVEPVFREFYSERDVVMEERLRRTETHPWGKLYEELMGTAFLAHPYGYPTLGWMSDIGTLTMGQAAEFFETYYGPNNAVAAIVGDIDIEWTKELIKRYFGAIPPRGDPAPVLTKEPEQKGERRTALRWDAQPLLMLAYHQPTYPDRDSVALDLLQVVLTEGRSSRLYVRLVKEGRMASDVYSYEAPGFRYPHLLVIGAVPIAGHTTEEVEAVILEEIEKIAGEGITERELQKAKNRRLADHWRGLQSNMGIARGLTYYQSVIGDWRYMLRYLEQVEATTGEDIQRVVREYLTEKNRTAATLVKVSPRD
jgi:predicted Zn-dependent peptidase